MRSEDGDLTVVESGEAWPFAVARIYYIYKIPTSATRGGHAHKRCHELLVALRGEFSVTLEARDGEVKEFRLNDPASALYVPPLYWRTLGRFTDEACCLVFASERYDADEYLRDHDEFRCFPDRTG
jgi:dTDP-4-dehydrorhamnose 3,5-epimerase-like enzyme